MNSKEYTLPNGKKAVFEYDVCGIGKITLECMDELMAMIADRPQGEWIPCSERLPEKNGEYLITLGFVWGREIEIGFYEDGEWLNDNRHVNIAWMPLPKPWKGADDE